MPTIAIITFGYFERAFLTRIAEAVELEFNSQVMVRDAHIDLGEFFDANRRQYNADKLLKVVSSMIIPEADKTIGIFQVDLFIPILTYLFGQAQLGGRYGIASLYRLDNERYGMKPDQELLQNRFIKEIIHETGHTFGLLHCHTPDCVMRSSTYVEDIDQKNSRLCGNCIESLPEYAHHKIR